MSYHGPEWVSQHAVPHLPGQHLGHRAFLMEVRAHPWRPSHSSATEQDKHSRDCRRWTSSTGHISEILSQLW